MVMDLLFVINAVVIVGFLFIWSLVVFRKKNLILAEIGWPLSLVLATAVSFLIYGSSSIYRRLLVLTVTIWGLRLAFSLYVRHWNRPERHHFGQLDEKTDSKFSGIKAFVSVFIVPAIIFYVVSLPLTIGFLDSQTFLVWWQYAGLALWAIGVLIEMGTESQIRRFESKPENEGKLITKGFWRLSRHPHYFGTALVWWGIFLISAVDWNNLLGILSPIVMTLYLVYLASRSPIEAEYKQREDLQNYTRKTPQFFPFATQIAAVLSGIGRMISKLVSSTRKNQKHSDEKELIEPITENDVNPVPFVESPAETNWFKPEASEDELASHSENEEVWAAEASTQANTDEYIADEEEHDESTIEDMVQDNEFSDHLEEPGTLMVDNEESLPIEDEEVIQIVEEDELVNDADSLSVATEEPVENPKVNSEEEPYEVVGEIPGSDIDLDVEQDTRSDDLDPIEETEFEKEIEEFVEGNNSSEKEL